MSERRLGVYVCNCGGNISDYVDVERVVEAVKDEPGVVVARRAMFTCSDGTQQEIVDDIRREGLDGLVVASCSPKLHTFTFRAVAQRAGLNPYEYTQVNIREQCSWTHTDDPEGATSKAISLVRAGIARTRLTEPLEPVVVETTPRALVIGGGIAGMRAAIGLADVGLAVFLVERAPELGGWVGGFGELFPNGKDGRALIARLAEEIRRRPEITVFTGAELTAKSGTFGNYRAIVHAGGESIQLEVGQIVVATGFDSYEPQAGELGYGIDGVLTLADWKRLLDSGEGPLVHAGKPVESVAYVYCVGSRNAEHPYCSRFCCSAAVHAALLASGRDANIRQYHLYRDLRTDGKNELMLGESRKRGSLYLRFADDDPPEVARNGDGLTVTVRDLLTGGEELVDPGRPRRARDGDGAPPQRSADRNAEAAGRTGRLLQRDPPEAAPGRDGRRRRPDRRRLPGAEDVRGERRLRPRRRHAGRRRADARGCRARPPGGRRRRRGLHRLRRVRRVVPVRCDLAARARRRRAGGDRRGRLQGLRRLRPGLPGERDRPPGVHRRAGARDDRRAARGGAGMSRDIREVVRDEPLMRSRLLELLQDGPLTVPELAAAGGLPEDEVMVWTMGLRKYGYVAEEKGASGEGYFRYAAVRRP